MKNTEEILSYCAAKWQTRVGSVLDNIKGIGPAKRNALLAHFKSVDNIRTATPKQLTEVPGITEKNAAEIKEYFGCL